MVASVFQHLQNVFREAHFTSSGTNNFIKEGCHVSWLRNFSKSASLAFENGISVTLSGKIYLQLSEVKVS